MKIDSKTVTVPADRAEVFAYVTDLNNFQNLLPKERITDWESRNDYCSFKVQGTATIDLHLKETKGMDQITLQSGDRSPFSFSLNIFLSEASGQTNAFQIMEADINPFLKMMVEKPLGNLFNYIADSLVSEFSK